jgi:hypothetical protein
MGVSLSGLAPVYGGKMKVKMTKAFKCYLDETEYNDLEKNQEIDVNEKDYNFLVNKKGVAELVKVVKKEIKKEVPVKDEVKPGEMPVVETENVQEKEDPEENNPEEKAEVPKKETDKKEVPKKGRKAGRKPRK